MTGAPAQTARAERYREILATPPPPAAVRPLHVDRVVDRAAVTGGDVSRGTTAGERSAAAVPATGRKAPEGRVPDTPVEPPKTSRGEANSEPHDPDSDVVPPRLLHVEFQPPQIKAGEATLLIVTAVDEFSGVRGVSGVVMSPAGTIQGFAAQREVMTDRYTSEIRVPPEAADGIWQVRHMTLTDQASNSVTLNHAAGALPPSAVFRVVSESSDTTGPVLKRIWIDRPSMRGGETNTLFVEAEDDKAGVAGISGVFISPRKQARLGFGCRPGAEGTWTCGLTPPGCLDCGGWVLEQVQLQDKAGNLATFRADDPLVAVVRLDITAELCDADPPLITSLVLEPALVSNSEGGTVSVQAIVSDAGCGVASLSGQATPLAGTGGQRAHFSLQPSGGDRAFQGTITIPKNAARGVWRIAWIQALDRGLNLRAYTTSEPVVAQATFRVE